jgi:hypothetical protein
LSVFYSKYYLHKDISIFILRYFVNCESHSGNTQVYRIGHSCDINRADADKNLLQI